MNILRYKSSKHLSIISSWLIKHETYVPDVNEMPVIGYIAFDRGQPIAAAFLRKVEGGFGQFDGLVSNPEALGSIRHEAIDALVIKIANKAKTLKLKQLFALTRDSTVLNRSMKHGFKVLPHVFIALSTDG